MMIYSIKLLSLMQDKAKKVKEEGKITIIIVNKSISGLTKMF